MNNWIEKLQQLSAENNAISESKILSNLPYERLNEWDNFMRGKTCPILDNGDHGVYSWDLKQFLARV